MGVGTGRHDCPLSILCSLLSLEILHLPETILLSLDAERPLVHSVAAAPAQAPGRDLVELVRYAEKFVTGLITNGRALTGLAGGLKAASLDYIQVSIESADPAVHDAIVRSAGAWDETVRGIRAALQAGMYISTNTTLTQANARGFADLLRFLAAAGIRQVKRPP